MRSHVIKNAAKIANIRIVLGNLPAVVVVFVFILKIVND